MKIKYREACRLFVIAICANASVALHAVSGYVCVVNESTGFSRSEGEWKSTSFRAGRRYNVSRAQSGETLFFTEGQKPVWVVKEVGDKNASFWCKSDFTSAGAIRCDGVGGEFWFNRENLRFQEYYAIGYVNDSKGDTPLVAIGTCSSY